MDAVVCHHCFSGFFRLPVDGADHCYYGRVCHYYFPDDDHYSADGTPDSVHRHFLLESVPVLFQPFSSALPLPVLPLSVPSALLLLPLQDALPLPLLLLPPG